MTPLDHFIYSALLTSITTLFLGAFVYLTNPKSNVNRSFACYSLAISAWSICVYYHGSAPTAAGSLFWGRALQFGAISIPVLFYHFVLIYLRQFKERKKFILLIFCYAAWLAFQLLNLTDLFVPRVRIAPPLNYLMVAGPAYHVFILFFFSLTLYSIWLLYRELTRAGGVRKTQLKFFVISSLFGYAGGVDNFYILYGWHLPVLFPLGTYAVALYVAVATFIILKYRFMDIEVIIKKTLVFAGLFGVAMAVAAMVTALTQNLIGRYFAISPVVSLTASVVAAILLYDPTRKLLVRLTDRYLFQKKESFKIILNRLSSNIISILDIDEVGQTILLTLEDSLRVESGAILLKDEDGVGYYLLNSFNLRTDEKHFRQDDILIQYFIVHEDILNLEDEKLRSRLTTPVLERLKLFNGNVFIPLLLHNDLIGMLMLGKKKSDEPFTKEETDYFPTVAGQVAVALSNARLYDILKKSELDFAQQAKMAAIGTLSAGINHEIKNPLNAIKVGADMIKLNKKLGVYDTLTKEEFEKQVFETMEIILKNVQRATDVMDRLSQFAKKPKEHEMAPVQLEKCLDEVYALLESEFEANNIVFHKRIVSGLPAVMADERQLEEVFLNLLVNARHAINEKGEVLVEGKVDNGNLFFSIHDSGSGIAQENLDKIFDPFFTTKDTSRNKDPKVIKGSGLGLFLCREIVKKYGGHIQVASELGKGTTFTLVFPVGKETP